MLAAAPAEDARILEVFRLALAMVGQGKSDIPPQLVSYFDTVLEQARRLSTDPKSVSSPIMPEAIQLALELRDFKSFRDAVDGITTLSAVSPSQANEVLSSWERLVAA
jgi:hypothetical protein